MNKTCDARATTYRLPHPLEIVRAASHLHTVLFFGVWTRQRCAKPQTCGGSGQGKTSARDVIPVKGVSRASAEHRARIMCRIAAGSPGRLVPVTAGGGRRAVVALLGACRAPRLSQEAAPRQVPPLGVFRTPALRAAAGEEGGSPQSPHNNYLAQPAWAGVSRSLLTVTFFWKSVWRPPRTGQGDRPFGIIYIVSGT